MLTKEEIVQLQELVKNRPEYPDLDGLIASGDLAKMRGGYLPLTQKGLDAIKFFAISITVDHKTGKGIFKLSRPRKRKNDQPDKAL